MTNVKKELYRATSLWQSQVDQLLTGLHRKEPNAVQEARVVLALFARDLDADALTNIFEALSAFNELKTEGSEDP